MVFENFFDGIKHFIGTFNLMTTVMYLLVAFLLFVVVMFIASIILMFIYVFVYSCLKCFPMKWKKKSSESDEDGPQILDIEYGPDHKMASNGNARSSEKCHKQEDDGDLTDTAYEMDEDEVMKLFTGVYLGSQKGSSCGSAPKNCKAGNNAREKRHRLDTEIPIQNAARFPTKCSIEV
ncbi:hypothetical protein DdX_18972 [Ditylenchus destructor]|uniref:Uncharacterized protein n=1 Tax=Ditylenchus destructor TaxID=166010 RepID=A0AAD4MJZ2_9BILA|nr:hypothetical protein DdX_18972 [Ditylenchus destructor]